MVTHWGGNYWTLFPPLIWKVLHAVLQCSGNLQFLSDNGGAYRAHETHAIARQLGLTPIHTPVCSPQSNGMLDSFVNTFKRDYVSQMDRSTAAIVLAQLPDAFTHFNEVHPHSALKWKSPRMYRRELARQARENDAN
jgi:putative transposase